MSKQITNTYTEHSKTIKSGIVAIEKGTVVTSIVILPKGGCMVSYRKYEDCPLRNMLIDGGIAVASKRGKAAPKRR